ncbi:MAG: DNA polymerase III subunit delta' [Dehalococcoidales bacterium]|nr:DNA polymerase III subunit delta' [Dehalococcoidales bacterium]
MWRLIGHERVVAQLEQAFKAGRLSHAYLIVGPRHVGKMTLARLMAQALNCGAEDPPCLECDSCRKIGALTHADVQVVGLREGGDEAEAKLIGIEQVREIQRAASLSPFEGKRRVFIIDGAELLSVEAANCFLKTLEEPPERVTFILLSTGERQLLPTIVSRCQKLELAPLPAERLAATLVELGGISAERAGLLARLAHGCPGWALLALQDEGLLERRREAISGIMDIIRADSLRRFEYAGQLASRFAQSRKAVYDALSLWLELWRDLLCIKLGGEGLVTNTDCRGELASLADGLEIAEIRGFVESIRLTVQRLEQNANPRLALEVMMLDMPRLKSEVA